MLNKRSPIVATQNSENPSWEYVNLENKDSTSLYGNDRNTLSFEELEEGIDEADAGTKTLPSVTQSEAKMILPQAAKAIPSMGFSDIDDDDLIKDIVAGSPVQESNVSSSHIQSNPSSPRSSVSDESEQITFQFNDKSTATYQNAPQHMSDEIHYALARKAHRFLKEKKSSSGKNDPSSETINMKNLQIINALLLERNIERGLHSPDSEVNDSVVTEEKEMKGDDSEWDVVYPFLSYEYYSKKFNDATSEIEIKALLDELKEMAECMPNEEPYFTWRQRHQITALNALKLFLAVVVATSPACFALLALTNPSDDKAYTQEWLDSMSVAEKLLSTVNALSSLVVNTILTRDFSEKAVTALHKIAASLERIKQIYNDKDLERSKKAKEIIKEAAIDIITLGAGVCSAIGSSALGYEAIEPFEPRWGETAGESVALVNSGISAFTSLITRTVSMFNLFGRINNNFFNETYKKQNEIAKKLDQLNPEDFHKAGSRLNNKEGDFTEEDLLLVCTELSKLSPAPMHQNRIADVAGTVFQAAASLTSVGAWITFTQKFLDGLDIGPEVNTYGRIAAGFLPGVASGAMYGLGAAGLLRKLYKEGSYVWNESAHPYWDGIKLTGKVILNGAGASSMINVSTKVSKKDTGAFASLFGSNGIQKLYVIFTYLGAMGANGDSLLTKLPGIKQREIHYSLNKDTTPPVLDSEAPKGRCNEFAQKVTKKLDEFFPVNHEARAKARELNRTKNQVMECFNRSLSKECVDTLLKLPMFQPAEALSNTKVAENLESKEATESTRDSRSNSLTWESDFSQFSLLPPPDNANANTQTDKRSIPSYGSLGQS